MATTSNVSVSITTAGDINIGPQTFGPFTNLASPAQAQKIPLTTGNNTITVPTGCNGVIIIPPSGNAVATKWKGVAGDTGTLMNLLSAGFFPLDPTVTSFVLNVASNVTYGFIFV